MVEPDVRLSGWQGAWPPDDGALTLERDEIETDDAVKGEPLSAIDWYRSERLRRFLASEDLPMTGERILKNFGPDGIDRLQRMRAAGLAESHGAEGVAPENRRWRLTREGRHTLRWAGAIKPTGLPERGVYLRRGGSWASQLSHAIAQHYDVDVADMLSSVVGQGVVARARLCFALFARGWSRAEIATYYALPVARVESAIARWRRMRDAA